ncbi:hypothetical protein QAD02_004948 [Eretmocerus hayati]|uniref:Uncharacterized protein n=1 Tax=Eretmocerus hayati TaxID=131215 RepID=A0ACC2NRD3_9HYME|nr:hypothetical protein QAD02_004948 [Eretmocerus hayati]
MGAPDPLCRLPPGLTLSDVLTKCKESCGDPKIDDARVILAAKVAGISDKIRPGAVRRGFLDNPHKLPCFRIVLRSEFSDPGLFSVTKEDCSSEFVDNKAIYDYLATPQDASFYQQSDKEIIDGVPFRKSGLYCVNLESHSFITGVLEENPVMQTSNVHPRTNPCVGTMPGINTSMYYVGGVNSCSEMHREDGKLASVAVGIEEVVPVPDESPAVSPVDIAPIEEVPVVTSSCNIVPDTGEMGVMASIACAESSAQNVPTVASGVALAIDELPFKLWLCVPDGQALEDAIHKSAEAGSSSSDCSPAAKQPRKRARRRKSSPRKIKKRRCLRLLDHKIPYITIDFLDRHNIKYFTFRQYKNDLVYLLPGVYHQVIQMSPNCLEASNFGDAEWQVITGQESVCGCPDQKVVSIPKNPNVRVRLIQVPVDKHLCEDCGFGASTMLALCQHKKEVHQKATKRVRLPKECAICGDSVTRMSAHLSRPSKKHLAAEAKLRSLGIDPTRAPLPILTCTCCGSQFSDEEDHLEHETACVRDASGTVPAVAHEPMPSSSKYSSCSYCKKLFFSGELFAHRTICTAKPHKCGHCPKTFTRSHSLKKHVARDHFECDHCHQWFASKRLIEAHLVLDHL